MSNTFSCYYYALFKYSLTKIPHNIDKTFIVIQKKRIVKAYGFNSLG